MPLLVFFKFRKDRQSQHVQRGAFRFRQIAGSIAKISETFLQMQRNGVINLSTNTAFAEESTQLVAITDANHILVIDVVCAGKRF